MSLMESAWHVDQVSHEGRSTLVNSAQPSAKCQLAIYALSYMSHPINMYKIVSAVEVMTCRQPQVWCKPVRNLAGDLGLLASHMLTSGINVHMFVAGHVELVCTHM